MFCSAGHTLVWNGLGAQPWTVGYPVGEGERRIDGGRPAPVRHLGATFSHLHMNTPVNYEANGHPREASWARRMPRSLEKAESGAFFLQCISMPASRQVDERQGGDNRWMSRFGSSWGWGGSRKAE